MDKRGNNLLADHIAGLVKRVATTSFPTQKRIYQQYPVGQGIAWLKELRYWQLAAICVECYAFTESISAEDPLGDHIRSKVVLAWQAVGRFANLALSQRESQPTSAAPTTSGESILCALHTSGAILSVVYNVRLELELLRQWQDVVRSMTIQELQGFEILCRDLLPTMYAHFREWDTWETNIPMCNFYGGSNTFSVIDWSLLRLSKSAQRSSGKLGVYYLLKILMVRKRRISVPS